MPIQTRITWAITIHVQAPFSTASALPARFGIDTPLLRNHRGDVIIPGTLVQGRVFEEATNWPGFDTLKKHLGDPAQDNVPANTAAPGNLPHRKQLVFGDFVMAESPPAGTTQAFTRIALDENTAAVKTGALQIIEQAALAGKSLEFKGTLTGYVDASTEAALTKQLRAALGLIPNLGGERSVGYGVVTGVTVADPIAADTAAFTWPDGATSAALTLHFDRPVLVAEPNPNGNLFRGSSLIPGNVIKGALADTLLAVIGKLPTGFDDLIVRHGFCAAGATRPRAIPLSLSEFKNNTTQVVDLATLAEPQVLGQGGTMTAAKFAIDWKVNDLTTPTGKKLSDEFGWAHPGRDLRVRVAINPTTRAAEDKKLFAYDAVLHESWDETGCATHRWHTIFDISQVKDKQSRADLINALNTAFASGLFPLGKTKAVARVAAPLKHVPAPALAATALTAKIILTLQTPALLTAKREVGPGAGQTELHAAIVCNDSCVALGPGAGQTELHAAYRAYFAKYGLTLSHFYARQTLRGGGYQQRRFQGTRTYAPWLLTDAGSVFVLNVTPPEGCAEPTESEKTAAHAKLTQWLNQGMPIASGWPATWQTNPYLPENGFGEVLINQAEHTTWSPKSLGVTAHPITSLVA